MVRGARLRSFMSSIIRRRSAVMGCSVAEVSGARNALILAQREHGSVTGDRRSGDRGRWWDTRSEEAGGERKPWTREEADASGLYRACASGEPLLAAHASPFGEVHLDGGVIAC